MNNLIKKKKIERYEKGRDEKEKDKKGREEKMKEKVREEDLLVVKPY